jgi:sRNA-binding protein
MNPLTSNHERCLDDATEIGTNSIEAPEAHPHNDEPTRAPLAVAADASTAMSFTECQQRLKVLFPSLFVGAVKPLKLRVQNDIQERAPGVFSKRTLSVFFRRYTGSTSYLLAVSKSKFRFDLDGEPAGELSHEHRQAATEELARRRSNNQLRHEKEAQERLQRAALLRKFKTTTLTRANFCALNGVSDGELDAILARAEQEANEEPHKPPAPNRERPSGHPDRVRRGESLPRRASHRTAKSQAL